MTAPVGFLSDLGVAGALALLVMQLRAACVRGEGVTLDADAAEVALVAFERWWRVAEEGPARPPAIAEEAPALERWRRQVLDAPERRAHLEVAAAWELTALECERAGETELAADARSCAHRYLVPRRRTA